MKLRHDYYARTISKVRESRLRSATQSDAIHAEVTESREDNLALLERSIGIRIIRVQKHMSTPPCYVIELADGGEISVGDVTGLIEQGQLRKHLANASGFYMRKFKAYEWDKIAPKLLAICEVVDIAEEATDTGAMKTWLHFYLARTLHRDDDVDYQRECVFYGLPAILNGKVHITLSEFKLHLQVKHGEWIKNRELAVLLRRIGCVPKKLSFHFKTTGAASTSRSTYVVPDEILHRAVEAQKVEDDMNRRER